MAAVAADSNLCQARPIVVSVQQVCRNGTTQHLPLPEAFGRSGVAIPDTICFNFTQCQIGPTVSFAQGR